MQRRELFKLFGAGAVLPVLSPELFGILRAAQPQTAYALRTFNPHQNATVVQMTDLIIPATDTPGAKAAKVNEFIDLILTEWAEDEDKKHFLDGLADVDKQSNTLFGKDFVDASTEQQVALLHAMDDVAASERGGRQMRAGNTVPRHDQQLKGNFFNVFRGITLHGYYTSEIGFTQELKLEIIPGAQHGCQQVGAGLGGN
jgi:hypothetical protein